MFNGIIFYQRIRDNYSFLLEAPQLHVVGSFTFLYNIGDKESSSDLETGAEPHRLELEEEFGWRSLQDFGIS